MFNTIVVGTDGSQNALAAVKATAELAAAGDGATVHVVNAYHPLSAAQVREVSA